MSRTSEEKKHQDNTRQHDSLVIRPKLFQFVWKVFTYLSYSQDIEPFSVNMI